MGITRDKSTEIVLRGKPILWEPILHHNDKLVAQTCAPLVSFSPSYHRLKFQQDFPFFFVEREFAGLGQVWQINDEHVNSRSLFHFPYYLEIQCRIWKQHLSGGRCQFSEEYLTEFIPTPTLHVPKMFFFKHKHLRMFLLVDFFANSCQESVRIFVKPSQERTSSWWFSWNSGRGESIWKFYVPIGSMHGILTYIWLMFMVNAGTYSSPMDFSWDTLVSSQTIERLVSWNDWW